MKAAMSESSTNSTRSNWYCFCGIKVKRRTSWTDLNPGRRFGACDQNRNSQTRHHFFEWLDNETCQRGKEVLPGLLRRLRGMEKEIRARDEQLRLVEVEKKKLEEKVGVVIKRKKELEWSRHR
ncbi:TatD related DNase, partial [Prunus dulcis]